MAIPIKYNIRSVMVRRTGTLMAVLSVAATVAPRKLLVKRNTRPVTIAA